MTIGTNDSVDKFGTQDQLTSSSSAVANTAISVVADMPAWTNNENVDMASVSFKGTLAVSGTAGTFINLYARKLNVQSTDDDLAPNITFKQTFVGSLAIISSTAQAITIDIPLPNYKTNSEFEFYIINSSGQSLNAGWTIYITPKTIGPKV